MTRYDLSPLFPYSVGFDRLDKLFETAFAGRDTSYPPYNIARTGEDQYRITMAVAGFSPDEIELTQHESTLLVFGQKKSSDEEKQYLHRGIARRAFEHRFQLADHVRVAGAKLANGLLDIELVREVPEAMKPQKIAINRGPEPKVIEGHKAEKAAA